MNKRLVNDMDKCVSVIVPVFNAEKYLKRCLESILAQSYKNWVAILVNDGSTDSSLDILNFYAKKDKRFRVINKGNGGAASARNAGLDTLQTDYFCFVDADDSIHEDYIKLMYDAALMYNCDLVIVGRYCKDVICNPYMVGLNNLSPLQYLKFINCGPCGKLYSRKILDSRYLRFPEDMKYSEDYVFTVIYALRVKKYYSIPKPLYNYHLDNPNSLIHCYGRQSMQLEQYLFSAEAPWRVYRELLSERGNMSEQLFSMWSTALYNELWRMYYFSSRYLTRCDEKILKKHFTLRHRDFVKCICWYKRLLAPQRWPWGYAMLKKMWHRMKILMKR